MKKLVFLPVETEVRELDAKLLMASKLVSKDIACFVGQHNFLNKLVPLYKEGVYMGKNIFLENMNSSNAIFDIYKAAGFSILWNHEEGAIYGGDQEKWDNELRELLDPCRLKSDDMILCWGEYQKKFYDSYHSGIPSKVVGGYRLDLGQESQLYKLIENKNRVELKDYILIDTNCAWGNHFMPNQVEYVKYQKKAENTKSSHFTKHNLVGLLSEDLIKIGYFCELISYLIKNNPKMKFVLRPHPTESISFYKNVFHGFKNIHITKEYSAVEWIMNCKTLIQSGCTTSLEAFFMKKPIVSFHPFETKYSVNVTQCLGNKCSKFEEVDNFINNPSAINDLTLDEFGLKTLIANFNSKSSSIELIVNEILGKLKDKRHNKIDIKKIKRIEQYEHFYNSIKFLPRKYFFKNKEEAYQMAIDHFPGFDKRNIEQKVQFLSKQLKKKIKIQYFSKNLTLLSE